MTFYKTSAEATHTNLQKENGNFIIGGAILNDDGKMIGSSMILQFEKPQELQNWMDSEPYIQQKVWEKFDVKPFRVANV